MSVATNPIAAGWLNDNSLREYPFHEGVGLRPYDSSGSVVSGGWRLPNCLVVDMSVSVGGADFDPFMYLGQMSVVDGGVTLVFCDRNGDSVMTMFVGRDHVKNTSYQVAGVGSFWDARGVVCIGDLDEFLSMTPDGMYRFAKEETMIEPTCIRPSSSGVRSLVAVDPSSYLSARLTGDVSLVAGENIRIDVDRDTNSIVISADENSGYTEDCDCGKSAGKVVRSINGIAVEDVEIVGDECVEVSRSGNVIHITDACSKPCCGCAETEFINQTVNDLQTSVNTLDRNISSLGDRLQSFISSYVLSRKTLQ